MIAIIDYDAGNTCSVMNALNRLHAEYLLTDNPEEIKNAEKVIFPGVGHAKMAMNTLAKKGLTSVLMGLSQPVLGICLGMQLLCERSEEGDTQCLGIIPIETKKFRPSNGDPFKKVPHMGWNLIRNNGHALFNGLEDQEYVYFVHSYYVPDSRFSIAQCSYNLDFSAAVQYKNYYGVQFHPEKSGPTGERILKNFLSLT